MARGQFHASQLVTYQWPAMVITDASFSSSIEFDFSVNSGGHYYSSHTRQREERIKYSSRTSGYRWTIFYVREGDGESGGATPRDRQISWRGYSYPLGTEPTIMEVVAKDGDGARRWMRRRGAIYDVTPTVRADDKQTGKQVYGSFVVVWNFRVINLELSNVARETSFHENEICSNRYVRWECSF